MKEQALEYRIILPPAALAPYVESCWMLVNHAGQPREVVLLPDGRVDLIFSRAAADPYHVVLLGLDATPSQTQLAPGVTMFAVSFRLPAVEYVLHTSIAPILNAAALLPDQFWGIGEDDLSDFDGFCATVFQHCQTALREAPDNRKLELFELLYASHGEITVKELSDKVFWSARQINRYFNQQFGLSLKAYGNILRFRASFPQIKQGKLFPEGSFTDQAHFIREVKRFAGVTPRALHKNQDDRFIQFSTLPRK
jgi:AraC-like DNA-binding protein